MDDYKIISCIDIGLDKDTITKEEIIKIMYLVNQVTGEDNKYSKDIKMKLVESLRRKQNKSKRYKVKSKRIEEVIEKIEKIEIKEEEK